MNIPESNNDVPDILDEIRWNLEWMLTMQGEDGGVFHKLTTKQFCGTVMPDRDTKPRFAIGKSITATWDFVGVLALAADIYKTYDAEFSEKRNEFSSQIDKQVYSTLKKINEGISEEFNQNTLKQVLRLLNNIIFTRFNVEIKSFEFV